MIVLFAADAQRVIALLSMHFFSFLFRFATEIILNLF